VNFKAIIKHLNNAFRSIVTTYYLKPDSPLKNTIKGINYF